MNAEPRIIYDETDGALDDLFVQGMNVHVERMTKGRYSILIWDAARQIHLAAKNVHLEWQDPADFGTNP